MVKQQHLNSPEEKSGCVVGRWERTEDGEERMYGRTGLVTRKWIIQHPALIQGKLTPI